MVDDSEIEMRIEDFMSSFAFTVESELNLLEEDLVSSKINANQLETLIKKLISYDEISNRIVLAKTNNLSESGIDILSNMFRDVKCQLGEDFDWKFFGDNMRLAICFPKKCTAEQIEFFSSIEEIDYNEISPLIDNQYLQTKRHRQADLTEISKIAAELIRIPIETYSTSNPECTQNENDDIKVEDNINEKESDEICNEPNSDLDEESNDTEKSNLNKQVALYRKIDLPLINSINLKEIASLDDLIIQPQEKIFRIITSPIISSNDIHERHKSISGFNVLLKNRKLGLQYYIACSVAEPLNINIMINDYDNIYIKIKSFQNEPPISQLVKLDVEDIDSWSQPKYIYHLNVSENQLVESNYEIQFVIRACYTLGEDIFGSPSIPFVYKIRASESGFKSKIYSWGNNFTLKSLASEPKVEMNLDQENTNLSVKAIAGNQEHMFYLTYSNELIKEGQVFLDKSDKCIDGECDISEIGSEQFSKKYRFANISVSKISLGKEFGVLLSSNYEAYTFGFNRSGELGLNLPLNIYMNSPHKVKVIMYDKQSIDMNSQSLKPIVVDINAGQEHSLLLIKCPGKDMFVAISGLGYGNTVVSDESRFLEFDYPICFNTCFKKIDELSYEPIHINAGKYQTAIICQENKCYMMGHNKNGILGAGNIKISFYVHPYCLSFSNEVIHEISFCNNNTLFITSISEKRIYNLYYAGEGLGLPEFGKSSTPKMFHSFSNENHEFDKLKVMSIEESFVILSRKKLYALVPFTTTKLDNGSIQNLNLDPKLSLSLHDIIIPGLLRSYTLNSENYRMTNIFESWNVLDEANNRPTIKLQLNYT